MIYDSTLGIYYSTTFSEEFCYEMKYVNHIVEKNKDVENVIYISDINHAQKFINKWNRAGHHNYKYTLTSVVEVEKTYQSY